MNIFINRNGKNYGPYSLDSVKEYLGTGSLLDTDFAWYEGCTEWCYLSDAYSRLSGVPISIPRIPPPTPAASADCSIEPPSLHQDIYFEFANIARVAITNLLQRIMQPSSNESSNAAREMPIVFFRYAVEFSEICCQQFASILRQRSVLPQVRATPTQRLAEEIRSQCFSGIDALLLRYVEECKSYDFDLSDIMISGTQNNGQNTNLVDAAIEGAAMGQLAGGLGKTGAFLGKLNAFRSVLSTLDSITSRDLYAKKNDAIRNLARLNAIDFGKEVASRGMAQYLRSINQVIAGLLDYSYATCFGNEVDFALQSKTVSDVETNINTPLSDAIAKALELNRDFKEKYESGREFLDNFTSC